MGEKLASYRMEFLDLSKPMKKKKSELPEFEVWIEGYATTGESATASRVLREGEMDSKWEAVDFRQACVYALNELKWQMLYTGYQGCGSCYYDAEENSYWARCFYDNEEEARKSFG